MVKNPPANARDTSLILGSGRSPGGGMATHSSILAWRRPWTETLPHGGLQSMGSQELDTTVTSAADSNLVTTVGIYPSLPCIYYSFTRILTELSKQVHEPGFIIILILQMRSLGSRERKFAVTKLVSSWFRIQKLLSSGSSDSRLS